MWSLTLLVRGNNAIVGQAPQLSKIEIPKIHKCRNLVIQGSDGSYTSNSLIQDVGIIVVEGSTTCVFLDGIFREGKYICGSTRGVVVE